MTTTLEAGRELDALVAEKVMGIAPRQIRLRGSDRYATIYCDSQWWQDGHQDEAHVAMHGGPDQYSTDIAAAWAVVKRMQQHCCDFKLEKAGAAWYADFVVGSGDGETAPLAICRAALAALT